MNVGATEILLILVVLLVLFGAGQLPKLARSIGESARELRRGLAGKTDEATKDSRDGDGAPRP